MKLFKKILLVAVLAMGAAHAVIAPAGKSTKLSFDGTIEAGTLEQHYINVINKSGGTLARGSVVIPDSTADDGASVTTSITQGNFPLCVTDVSCTNLSLCSCQIYGYHNAVLFDAAIVGATAAASAGFQGFLSTATAGYVKGIAPGTIAGQDNAIGMFYDTATVSGAIEMFLRVGK